VLVALQQRVNDVAHLEDKNTRSEAHVKSVIAELHSIKQELQTKVEFVGLLQVRENYKAKVEFVGLLQVREYLL
jgi:hypothetical protein